MKRNNLFQNTNFVKMLFAAFSMCFIFVSCEDEDKNNLDSFQKTGAFVRFAEAFHTVVNVQSLSDVAGISISTTLEDTNNSVAS